jgi:hypothetical protein
LAIIEEVSDWRRELIDYLENGTLPSEKGSLQYKLKTKAGRFISLALLTMGGGYSGTLTLRKGGCSIRGCSCGLLH